jgi:hypothetical protein
MTNMTYREKQFGWQNLRREHILTLSVRNTPALLIYSMYGSPNFFVKPKFKLLLPGSSSFTIKF